jgi:hypothetical protein
LPLETVLEFMQRLQSRLLTKTTFKTPTSDDDVIKAEMENCDDGDVGQ